MALPLFDQRPPLADQGLSYPRQQEFDGPHMGELGQEEGSQERCWVGVE